MFQQILNTIEAALQPGAANVRQVLLFFMQIFVWLELLRALYAFLWRGHLLEPILHTLFKAATVYWALYNFPTLLNAARDTFVYLGLLAGGNHLTVQQFLDPGEWLNQGIRITALLYGSMHAGFGLTSIAQAIGYFLLWLVFLGAFAVMAINIFVWQLELLIAAVMLLMLLPALACRSTAWMGQGALAYVINKSFRFGVGALLASLTFQVLPMLTVTTPVSFQSVAVSCIGGWAIAMLFLVCNKMASGFLAGIPQLGAGTVVSTGLATAGLVTGVGTGVAAGITGATSGLLTAGRVGMGLGGALRGAGTVLASGGGPGMASRLGPALTAARHGASQALQSPLAARLGNWGGATRQVARGQGQRTLRQLADVARYIGTDHPGGGAR
jgi:type IV secretion system protein TrbL